MTPTEIETAARQLYNAVGDTNWSSSEIMTLIYGASLEVVRECGLVIEKKYTTTATASVGEYAFPTNAIGIKRVTFNGRKLKELTMREDDTQTLENQLTTDTGDPQYYYKWSDIIYIRPIPASAETIEVFATANPQAVTTTSTIEIPTNMHMGIRDYVVSEMAAKDQNFKMADYYRIRWETQKGQYRAFIRKNKVADGFRIVQVEELLPYGSQGSQ